VSDDNKGEGADKTVVAPPADKPVDSITRAAQQRDAIVKRHQQTEAAPVAAAPNSDEGKSEADKTAEEKSEIGAPQTGSVESESKTSVDKSQNKIEKPKGDLNKALEEEREKRKKANLEARQLREKYDADMAALRRENEELKRPKQEDPLDESDPEKAELARELREIRAKREADEQQKKQEDLAKQETVYLEKINKTHSELKEAGYPGFRFAQLETRQAILKRYNEGEFVDQDLNDPAIWKQVFVEDVYETMKDEFAGAEKKELMDKKTEAKKKAAMLSNPGPAPKADTSEKTPPTLDEMNRSYLQKRQEASRKIKS
jgi:hypothetical protein